MKKLLLISIFITIAMTLFSFETNDYRFQAGIGPSFYTWEEYIKSGNENNKKILTETGVLTNFILKYSNYYSTKSENQFEISANLYYGNIKYDGRTQDNWTMITRTNIQGYQLETGYMRMVPNLLFDVLDIGFGIGTGYETWNRSIGDAFVTKTNDPSTIKTSQGYEEEYSLWFLKLKSGIGLIEEEHLLYLEFGGILPIYFNEKVGFEKLGYNDFEVKPGKEISPFVSLICRPNQSLELKLDYKTLLVTKSDTVKVGSNSYGQPKSFRGSFDLTAAYLF